MDMKRGGLFLLVILGNVPGVVLAAGPSHNLRLSKVSKEVFLQSVMGKAPAVQSLASGLVEPAPGSSDQNRAPRFYLSIDGKVGLVEACLTSMAKASGLYVLSLDAGMDYYPWYDPPFNAWA